MDAEEKTPLLAVHQDEVQHANEERKSSHATRVIMAIALAFYTLRALLWFGVAESFGNPVKQLWTFDEIEPSAKLVWKPCFEYDAPYFCARLLVPMDYNRPETGPHIDLALVMSPAPGHGGDEWSPTPMLLNPGGPGGSGTQLLAGLATELRKVVGNEYDLVSWDPRGIGWTRPLADCFSPISDGNNKSSASEVQEGFFHRLLYVIEASAFGSVTANDHALAEIDVRSRGLAAVCAEKDRHLGNNSIFRHVSTPNSARDMVSIIDAWKSWREDILVEKRKSAAKISLQEVLDEPAAGKLVYWGFSYGTLLGATFASMYPDKIHRAILDGVVDADHYVDPVWPQSLLSADDVWSSLFSYCFSARGKCALYQPSDTSPANITSRVDALFARLSEQPLYGVDPNSNVPYYITTPFLRLLGFASLYSPRLMGPMYFSMLASLLQGTNPGFSSPISSPSSLFCTAPTNEQLSFWPMEAQSAIMCADKRYTLNDTLPALRKRLDKMLHTSSFVDVWFTLVDRCDGWSIPQTDPPMCWDDHPAHKQKPINTSYPLLFLSNSRDPVTPLKAGHVMAQKFVGAGLVELKTEGHCSLAAPSKCMTKKIREYFADEGKVPRVPGDWESGDWEKCEAEGGNPWDWKRSWDQDVVGEDKMDGVGEDEVEAEWLQAMEEIAVKAMGLDGWGWMRNGVKVKQYAWDHARKGDDSSWMYEDEPHEGGVDL